MHERDFPLFQPPWRYFSSLNRKLWKHKFYIHVQFFLLFCQSKILPYIRWCTQIEIKGMTVGRTETKYLVGCIGESPYFAII